MVDVAGTQGYLATSLSIMNLMQCIKQARWLTDSTLLTLPQIERYMLPLMDVRNGRAIETLSQLVVMSEQEIMGVLTQVPGLSFSAVRNIVNVVMAMPFLDIDINLVSEHLEVVSKNHVRVGGGQ